MSPIDLDLKPANPLLTESENHSQRACPLCGAFERKNLFPRDGWDIVKCSRCSMVFLGNPPLAYDAQAADRDWVTDHTRETSRRTNSRPVLTFLSRLTRPLRRGAQQRQFQHAVY
jgi:ribosomal protein L37AE/L43A